jgi:antitoxin HicB
MPLDVPHRFAVRPLTEEEGGGYLIEFPDLQSCMSNGETVEEAILNGVDATRGWIEGMQPEGFPVPALVQRSTAE